MMSEISEKAKELLESTVKNAVAYGQEKGNPFGLVSTYEAMFRLDKSDLEHYIASLEAENRALRHALEQELMWRKSERAVGNASY